MNESSHLTLEDLTTHAAARPLGAEAGTHLSSCPACQAELARWAAVAAGVRQLTDAVETRIDLIDSLPLDTDRTRPIRRRWSHRWAAGVIAAAAVLLFVLAGAHELRRPPGPATGSVAGGHAASPGAVTASAGLTDTGCDGLKAATGTLQTTGRDRFTLHAVDGQQVAVAATAATHVTRQVVGALDDITVGEGVIVVGQGDGAGEEVAAEGILLTSLAEAMHLDFPDRPDMGRELARQGVVIGTVAGTDGHRLTVTGLDGTLVGVTMSPSTTSVISQQPTDLRALEPGQRIVAVGALGADGTLHATAIQTALNSEMNLRLSVRPSRPTNCDPTAIATSALLAAGG